MTKHARLRSILPSVSFIFTIFYSYRLPLCNWCTKAPHEGFLFHAGCVVLVGHSSVSPAILNDIPDPRFTPHRTEHLLTMDITGHFESASCVIEVDGSDTLAQVKGKLLAEFGVPRARLVGVRMRGGGDIGDDDLRICDTVIDEGCAVELYCTGAIAFGKIPIEDDAVHVLTLSPCNRHLAVMCVSEGVRVFDTATHETLCSFPAKFTTSPAFSLCGEWISSVNVETQCDEVHHVKTGALKYSFGTARQGRQTERATAWSPCGRKLLSCCSERGLQVWDIKTGCGQRYDSIVGCEYVMVVAGNRVAMFGSNETRLTIWDYTTGVQVFTVDCPFHVAYVALSPNQRFVAACGDSGVGVWDVATGDCVFENLTEGSDEKWSDVAMSNYSVGVYSILTLRVWSISTAKLLLHRECPDANGYGIALSRCGGVLLHGGEGCVEVVDISQLSS